MFRNNTVSSSVKRLPFCKTDVWVHSAIKHNRTRISHTPLLCFHIISGSALSFVIINHSTQLQSIITGWNIIDITDGNSIWQIDIDKVNTYRQLVTNISVTLQKVVWNVKFTCKRLMKKCWFFYLLQIL